MKTVEEVFVDTWPNGIRKFIIKQMSRELLEWNERTILSTRGYVRQFAEGLKQEGYPPQHTLTIATNFAKEEALKIVANMRIRIP